MAETYDSLLLQLRAIVNRDPDTDTSFADALPGIFERAERRIARDLNLSDFTKTQTGTLVIGEEAVDRPGNIASSVTFVITVGQERKTLLWRSLAFLRGWWRYPGTFGEPRYIGLRSDDKFIVCPPPDQAYPYAYHYRRHAEYLGPTRQTNVISRDYPDLLIAALAFQTFMFAQEDARDAIRGTWEAEYNRLRKKIADAEAAMGSGQYEAGDQLDRGTQGETA